MAYRPGICAIIFKQTPNGPRFLVFHRIKNWSGYEFLKGGVKSGETEISCLSRELAEETGSRKYKIIQRTPYKIEYGWTKEFMKDHRKYIGASNRLYLIEFFESAVKIDPREHDGFEWVTEERAMELLTYQNLKDALEWVLKGFQSVFSA